MDFTLELDAHFGAARRNLTTVGAKSMSAAVTRVYCTLVMTFFTPDELYIDVGNVVC